MPRQGWLPGVPDSATAAERRAVELQEWADDLADRTIGARPKAIDPGFWRGLKGRVKRALLDTAGSADSPDGLETHNKKV